MKIVYPFFFFPILGFAVWGFSPPAKPAKIALIIAVGNYPSGSDWGSLSAANDVGVLKTALMKQGFEEANIAVLQDEQATRQDILHAIREHLINKAERGDVAIFHFSGHGQQVQDEVEGDEVGGDEVDGFDEAIVPFDSPLHFQAGVYEGENLIRDDELGALLNEVRGKLGRDGHLLTLIDACHSGTATRGQAKARGTHIKMASQAYINAHKNKPKDCNALATEAGAPVATLAPMVAFFSASPNQLSYEQTMEDGNTYGILSFTFSKAFGETNESTTYRDLFDKIRLDISALSPHQNAQSEGLLDVEVLGGEIKGRQPYFTVNEYFDNSHNKLDGGILAGLTERSVVVFYPLDTKDTTGVVSKAIGIVESAGLFSCEVELQGKKLGKTEAMNSKVFIRERNFGNLSVSLRLDIPVGSLLDALKTLPAKCPAIHIEEINPELVLQENQEAKSLLLFSKDGFQLGVFGLPANGNYKLLLSNLRQAIVAYAQAKFLRPLEIQDALLDISLGFFTGEGDAFRLAEKSSFQVGEKLLLRFTNTGADSFYFSVIDIRPSNELLVIVPWNKPAVDYFLLPGKHFDLEIQVDSTGGTGTDVLKLIASEQPLDLQNLIETRGEEGGGKHPLEILLRETYLPSGRGSAETTNVPNGGVAVKSVMVEVFE